MKNTVKKEKNAKATLSNEVVMTIAEHHIEMKRYIGALTEDFQDRVSAIGEQVLGLNEKVDKLDEKVDKLDEKFERKFDGLSQKIDNVQRVQDSHTEMIGNLMESMETVKDDIQTIKIDLRKKVDYDEFVKLERRVVLLEQKSQK